MYRLRHLAAVIALALVLAGGGILVAAVSGSAAANGLAPVADSQARSSHAPYLSGQCAICHDPTTPAGNGPGKVPADLDALCGACHYELGEAIKSSRVVHAPVMMGCSTCHNPHNSVNVSLLLDQPKVLCLNCHGTIQQTIAGAKVQHDAVIDEAACMNCHTPHASNIQHLLTALPFDLCVSCHSQDSKVDSGGRLMTNFQKLLAESPYHHGPIQAKDCSACHLTHGSQNHSLLVADYPPLFYSPYDPANYALCFRCHNDANMKDPQTTTTTRFRDGSRNLHYLHVNKSSRGRTCRACHEVHASENPHQVRNAVPFGPRNWMLPVNYTKTDTGGSCARTCHQTESYDYTKK